MAASKTGIKAHDDACAAAEGVRQVAVVAAAGNVASVRSAEVTYFKACKASALANGVSPSAFTYALISLFQTG
jgi:hypothetical protein